VSQIITAIASSNFLSQEDLTCRAMERLDKVRHKLANFHLHAAANLAVKIQHPSINMCQPDKFV